MKIIIYGKKQNDINQIEKLLQSTPLHITIFKFTKFKEFISQYKKHTYDFLIIDIDSFFVKKIEKILHETQQINNNQKTIVLSNTYNCYDLYGCNHCKSKYNNTLLNKPVSYQDLVYAISSVYFCNNIKSKKLLKKIKKIETKIENFTFDITSRTLINQCSFLEDREKNLQEAIRYLTKEKISYEIDHLHNILLLGKKQDEITK